jgi:plastocyanin
VNPTNSVTDATGIASTTVTLPAVSGVATITATSAGATGSPQTFTATATGASSAVNVQVVNTNFVPSVFELKVNGTVTFTWGAGSGPHNVTPVAPNTIPVSVNPGPPDTHSAPYSFMTVFPAVGTFKFYCGVHGAPDAGMSGTITVVP